MADSEIPPRDFRLGDWLVQPSFNRISRDDSSLTLEAKVMKVLLCLAEHPGDLVTRQQLTDQVWATEFISDNTVTHAVTELRNALGDDAKSPTYVETIHRKGYRLIVPVQRIGEDGQPEDERRATITSRWPHILAIGIAVVIGLLVILPPEALFERRGEEPGDQRNPRIVVLPFENLGSPEDEYFADGITDELISRLTAVSGLQVISRTSAMYYKDKNLPLKQIGEELDVGFVLEGTIRWDRGGEGYGRVRITPQLIQVDDDSHLWSDRYDRVLEDIFSVQSDIARQVIAELETTLLDVERRAIEVRSTQSGEAYQAYLLGAQSALRGYEEGDLRLAVDMLERAVQMDPEFSVAFAVLSKAHSMLYHFRYDFTDDRLAKAETAANRAMELQPDLPEGHLALGWYYYCGFRDYERAREHFVLASRSRPNDSNALFGLYVLDKRQGRLQDALESLERLRRFDPHRYDLAAEAMIVNGFLRRYEQAEKDMRRAISISPNQIGAYVYGSLNLVLREGATDRARRLLVSAPATESPYIEHRMLELDLFDRRPESALARLEESSTDVYNLDKWYLPKTLLECICVSRMGNQERVETACSSAIEVLEGEILARPHDYRIYIALGHAFALLDRREEAVSATERASELMPPSTDLFFGTAQEIELAKIYAGVGETDRAIDLIERLLASPSFLSVGLLRLDPVWDPLRDHPRFQEILEKYDVASN